MIRRSIAAVIDRLACGRCRHSTLVPQRCLAPFRPSGFRAFSSLPAKGSVDSGVVSSTSEADPRLHILFTCKVCSTRSAKSMSRQAYTHGVVIARCSGCNNLHLIADNLNYFGRGRCNIQDIIGDKNIVKIDDGTWEVPPEVVAGGSINIA